MPLSGGDVMDFSGLAIKASEFQDSDGTVLLDTITSTDNAIARFNSTAGVVQDSGITINDSDLMTLATGTGVTAAAGSTVTLSGTVTRTPVFLTGTISLTQPLHANRTMVITGTALATLTLPEATGTGDTYTLIFAQVNTNNTVIVAADTTNTSIVGSANLLDADGTAQVAYVAASGDDTITLNGTTTGGQLGDQIVLTDIATDLWSVNGQLICAAGSNVADPFSSAA